MNTRTLLTWMCLLSLLLVGVLWPTQSHAAPAAPVAASTFNTGAEGWTVTGDAASTPTYHPTGGNPGGYISATDSASDDTWYWLAPGKFLGNKAGAYGGVLRYELRQNPNDDQFDTYDVFLEGAGLVLAHEETYNPATIWTSYVVILDERNGWYKHQEDGDHPITGAEMKGVLADLTAISIRGEFQNGDDTGDLDNVYLEAPGVPTWQMLLGSTAIYLAGRTDVTIPPVGDDPGATGFPLARNCLGSDCVDEGYIQEQFPILYPASGEARFIFQATGGVNYYNDPHGNIGPDGTPDTNSEIDALGGISGYLGPAGSLVGVFLTNDNPQDGTPPDPLPLNISLATTTPALGQVFFIGDGLTGTGCGAKQVFTAPAGATRLFIGIADASSFFGPPGMYDDNQGAFWVSANRYKVYLPLTIKK